MITRGIIEEPVNSFTYKVRIPIFDRVESASQHTSKKNLLTATASINKGCNNQFQIGDVVFIAFENNALEQPVIIGHLYREALLADKLGPIIDARNLTVNGNTILSKSTKIGDIDYQKLYYLKGLDQDIQCTIDSIDSELDSIDSEIDSIKSEIEILKNRKATLMSLGNIKAGNGVNVSSEGTLSFSPVQTSATISYLDRDTINFCRGNRLECLPMSNIVSASIASKNFNDVNWGTPQSIIINNDVFNTSNNSGFTIGDNSDNIKDLKNGTLYSENEYIKKEYKLSLELKLTNIYASLQKLYFWVSTNGAQIKCSIYGKRGQDDTYLSEPLASTTLGGWSGSNLLPLDIIINGSASKVSNPSHYTNLKFVFESGPRQLYKDSEQNLRYRSYPIIMKIAAYGIDAWTHLNYTSQFDHMYSWDNDQNVNATSPLDGITLSEDFVDDTTVVTIGYLKAKGLIT